MQMRTLAVVPNPYSAIDADGRAQGVVMKENLSDQFVGAALDIDESRRTGKNIYKFDTAPVTVARTPYYLRRIAAGELLPADAETAKAAGLEDFESAEAALAKARADRQTEFENATGRVPMFAAEPAKDADAKLTGTAGRRSVPPTDQAEKH